MPDVSRVRKAQNLADNLTYGLTGYLTYESTGGLGQAFSEYFLYAPIIRIARAIGWEVVDQLPVLKSHTSNGPGKTIDFAMYRDKTIIMLEVKWVGRNILASNVLPKLRNDIDKLRSQDMRKAVKRRFSQVDPQTKYLKWIMVVGTVKCDDAAESPNVVGSGKVKQSWDSARLISNAELSAPRRWYGADLYEL